MEDEGLEYVAACDDGGGAVSILAGNEEDPESWWHYITLRTCSPATRVLYRVTTAGRSAEGSCRPTREGATVIEQPTPSEGTTRVYGGV